ncbi:MAG TPA: OmpA family protein [Bryobacteraceae bacterium]|jgi:outer membrane protein OmpA-like peptidoglycan-associated protein|nr:OmpA family protein [Bryobacteraceae bacterium]HXJ42561.1 OmpA family protein [Bryobacteraceae bacterium]
MNKTLGISLILTGALLAGGCATKKYVQQTAAPIQSKVDQVSDQSNKQGTSIEEARKDIERHETGINAAKERAISAENQAKEAMTAAQKADQNAMTAQSAADKNGREINSLRDSVNTTLGNLDDYKLQAETVVPFGFNRDVLSDEAKEQLDQFVKEHATAKRYFITIEGFTDKTGTKAYNDELSRRRAGHVMAYLITQHNIPVFRVQDVGLGNEKPADTGRNRAARAKNRRVEVRLFSADQSLTLAQKQ